jgi:hypothetical protein
MCTHLFIYLFIYLFADEDVACFMPVSCMLYISTLKMEVICSSEAWIESYVISQRTELYITTSDITSNVTSGHLR